jgi:SAM-dependent methyltransferase
MLWAEVLWGLIAIVLILDAIRIRGRLMSVPVLGDARPCVDDTHRFILAPGVELSQSTRDAAHAHLLDHGLAALDLVPGQLPLAVAWSIGCHVDPEAHRTDSLRVGDTAAHALLAPTTILDALQSEETSADHATFVSLAGEVRRRVTGGHDFAVAPELHALSANPFFDPGVLRVRLGGSIFAVALGIPVATFLILLGPFLAPISGAIALACHLAQQPIAMRGTRLQILEPWGQGALRVVTDVRQWLGLIQHRGVSADKVQSLRPVYEELLTEGTDRFFHPKATQCPMCSREEFTRGFTLPDLYQGKPGRFTVVRCKGCNHRFQNPRLNSEGLGFYYRDFYDGIGEDSLDLIFGATRALYEDRVALVKSVTSPRCWLDVGCGHGHLFGHVRGALPNTRLEGLDMGDGVDVGVARGWLDCAHKGSFPDLSSGLSGAYDVVSMCHYLEHTVDPRAELNAAHQVLEMGGHLLIEVPDPDSSFALLLGKWWMPWFQPQHLHFLSTVRMAKLLRDTGFEPVEWHTGRANTANDFVLSFHIMVSRWAGRVDVPWKPESTVFQRLRYQLVWVPGLVFVVCGALLDKMVAPLARRLHHVSQYRVIARKVRP